MTYKLDFYEDAFKEWKKLDATVREQFKAKLEERLVYPCLPSAKLRKSDNRYKIKLKQAGYRLVYEVIDQRLVVMVIAIGKRDHDQAHQIAIKRQ